MHVPFAPDRAEFYQGDPDAAFRALRAEDPVHWYEAGGFWCITRHADVQEVSRLPKLYSSERGTQLFEVPLRRGEVAAAFPTGSIGTSIIRMDPPRHNAHRKLVIRAFTPKRVGELEARIREIARETLAAVPSDEAVETVEAVAIPLPMLVIAEMLGVPASDRADFRRWSDAMVVAGGGGMDDETRATVAELFGYFHETVAERRRAPRNDLISALVQAEVDGERLSDPDAVMFCLTLLVAGNETTRNLVSGGLLALAEHPDQRRLLADETSRIPHAVEEMLRYVTPVRNFVRCAVRDLTLHGRSIREGDYVALLYASANRDEAVFGSDPDAFDVTRASAPRHVAFGYGEHLCLGASLARLEARIMFEELLARWPEFERSGPVEPLSSTLMNGLVALPLRFSE